MFWKRSGSARLISDDQPVLTVPVDTDGERGLLGIATASDFLLTEAKECEPLRNRIYGYVWNGQDLINPVLIIDLPAMPGPSHDGGKLIMGPDNHLYAIIGDPTSVAGQLQNLKSTGKQHNETSVIFIFAPIQNWSVC